MNYGLRQYMSTGLIKLYTQYTNGIQVVTQQTVGGARLSLRMQADKNNH